MENLETKQTQNIQYLEEDEIDLRELFDTIWKNKKKIVLFSFIVTFLTIVYTLSIPNSYISQTVLVPQTQSQSSGGGLSALAGLAGINIGNNGGDVDAETSLSTLLNDYTFQAYVIKKYDLINKLRPKNENLVFALGFDSVYNLFHSNEKDKDDKQNIDDKIFSTYKSIKSIVSISSDKKTSLITLSATTTDRFLSKELVDIYLQELTSYLRETEMKNVDKQISYYNQELQNSSDISLKSQLSQLASALVQKKVLSQANELYNVKQLTQPQVAYIKDKTKPKRGLIVVVSFVISIILGIFGIFFLEFLRNENK